MRAGALGADAVYVGSWVEAAPTAGNPVSL